MAARPGSETPSGTRNPNAPAQSGANWGNAHLSGGRAGFTPANQPAVNRTANQFAQVSQTPSNLQQGDFSGGAGTTVPTPLGTSNTMLPQWDPNSPYSGAGGLGTAYMNMFRPAGFQPQIQAGNNLIQAGLVTPSAFQNINRGLPGQADMDASRFQQSGALAGMRQAGAGAAMQQAMLPGQVNQNAQPGLNATNQLLQQAPQVGARAGGMQDLLSQHLLQQAMGQGGPTAAGAQFDQNLNRNIAAQRAMSAGVRGGSAASAARTGAQAGTQLGLEAQAQSAMLRAQEQQAAQGLSSQNLQASRGQDIQKLGVQAGVASQAQQDAASRDALIAQILGQSRGQDITQAGMIGDQAQALRQGDMAGSQLGLQGRGMDDALRQQQINNLLSGQQFLSNFAFQDQGQILDAAGVMGNLQTGQQHVANQRRSLELDERGQNIQLGAAGIGAVGTLGSSLITSGGGGTPRPSAATGR